MRERIAWRESHPRTKTSTETLHVCLHSAVHTCQLNEPRRYHLRGVRVVAERVVDQNRHREEARFVRCVSTDTPARRFGGEYFLKPDVDEIGRLLGQSLEGVLIGQHGRM